MILARRAFLTGLIAAPVIVRAGLIMPIKPLITLSEFDAEDIKFTATERPLRWAVLYGHDADGNYMTETIDLQKLGLDKTGSQEIRGGKNFSYVSHIQCTS